MDPLSCRVQTRVLHREWTWLQLGASCIHWWMLKKLVFMKQSQLETEQEDKQGRGWKETFCYAQLTPGKWETLMARSKANFAHGQQSQRSRHKDTGNNLISKEGMAKQGLWKRSRQGRPERGRRQNQVQKQRQWHPWGRVLQGGGSVSRKGKKQSVGYFKCVANPYTNQM